MEMRVSRKWCVMVFGARLFADDLYLMPDQFRPTPGKPLRVVLQNGDGFPEAGAATKADRLRDTRLLSKAGPVDFTAITVEAKRTTAQVQVPASGSAILTTRTIPRFIELDAAEFTAYLQEENLTNVIQWREKNGQQNKPGRERYSKYVKSLLAVGAADGFFQEKTGLTIEIIPEVDPYSLRPGQTLPVQVLLRGEPAADIAVESSWLEQGKAKSALAGRTDQQGRVRVPVNALGPHRLHAIVMERCAEPQVADWESFWATLTFAIEEPAR